MNNYPDNPNNDYQYNNGPFSNPPPSNSYRQYNDPYNRK